MSQNKEKRKIRRKITIESFIIFIIALSPILFKLYDYLPDDPEATISFFGFTIDNGGFYSVSVYFWFLLSKIIPLSLMIIWFFTSKNWWYHIILIPIAMYAFQVFEVLFDSDNNVDTENIWWLLPICMIIIPGVYFIRIKLYDKYVHGIDLEAMDAELKILKKTMPVEDKSSDNDEDDQDNKDKVEEPQIGYQTFSEYLNSTLSTNNIERKFRQFQNNLKGWLHLKF